jgi:poly-beta-1,6-N-acetyl-D-glucosamine synthase
LDCDLSFGSDYFEKLLNRFLTDHRLGIASGVYLEQEADGRWHEIKMPSYHAAGASKMIRRECFENIGGFIIAAGWDTVDEIRAMSLGWKTQHISSLKMSHHKREGSGIGTIKTSLMHGEIYYLTGGSWLFFTIKLLHRLAAKPYLLGALALLKGFFRAKIQRKALLVTDAEARCYRALLLDRLRTRAKALIPGL